MEKQPILFSYKEWCHKLVIVRGGGDIASGTIYKLYQCGFPLLVLEIPCPSCIRRTVSFCEAVFDGQAEVEGLAAVRVDNLEEAYKASLDGRIPVMVDPAGDTIKGCRPAVVVDAILAKRNLGTRMTDAPVVIGLGPGFTAGKDVHAVIETKRGHDLGRVIYQGQAAPNSGVPGMIAGYGRERVIHAPESGTLHIIKDIGEETKAGEVIALISQKDNLALDKVLIQIPGGPDCQDPAIMTPVFATIDGLIRGMIREGYPVKKGLKIADIDPRIKEKENCTKISDKARCVAGGVLEAILYLSSSN